jgi:hypothetical protein
MSSKQIIFLFILVLGTLTGTLDSTIVIPAFPTIAEKLRTDISAAIGLSSLQDFDRPSVYGFLGINISAKRGQVGRIRK